MAKSPYYTDEFREYFNTLSKTGTKYVNEARSLYGRVSNSFGKFRTLISGTSEWKCEMAKLFNNKYFTYVNECYETMSKNILDSIIPGYEKMDELVEILELLKETNEKYMNLLIEYSIEKSKNVEPLIRIRNKDNKVTDNFEPNPDYLPWINRMNELALEIENTKELLEIQKQTVFEVFSELEIFDENVVDLLNFTECVNMLIGEDTCYYDVVGDDRSSVFENLYAYNYNGTNFSIICEGYYLKAYENYLLDNNYFQKRGGWYPERCNDAATVHAYQLNNRIIRRNLVKSSKNLGDYSLVDKYVSTIYDANNSGSLLSIKSDVYDEVLSGRACALQVSRDNPNLRHWVTVIGFSDDVKGPNDLTPDKILVLDNWDGRVQTLSEYNRDFYAWSSSAGVNYQLIRANSNEVASITARNASFYASN